MKPIKIVGSALFSSITLLSASQWAFAATPPATINDFANTFSRVINFLFAIVGGIVVLMIVVGGIRYILSQGDPKAIDGAKGTITFAIVGLVVVLLAVFIVNIVGGIFNVGGLSNFSIQLQDPTSFFRSPEVTPVNGPR